MDLRRLRRVALNAQRQQFVGKLGVPKLVPAHERQDASEHRLTRDLGVLHEMERREMFAHHVVRQQARPVVVPEFNGFDDVLP